MDVHRYKIGDGIGMQWGHRRIRKWTFIRPVCSRLPSGVSASESAGLSVVCQSAITIGTYRYSVRLEFLLAARLYLSSA